MLHGAGKIDGCSVTQKQLIEDHHLTTLTQSLGESEAYDNCLFLAICFTAYHGLMHISKLVVPDDPKHLSIHKLTLCHKL